MAKNCTTAAFLRESIYHTLSTKEGLSLSRGQTKICSRITDRSSVFWRTLPSSAASLFVPDFPGFFFWFKCDVLPGENSWSYRVAGLSYKSLVGFWRIIRWHTAELRSWCFGAAWNHHAILFEVWTCPPMCCRWVSCPNVSIEVYHLKERVDLQGNLPCRLTSEHESSTCGKEFFLCNFLWSIEPFKVGSFFKPWNFLFTCLYEKKPQIIMI